MRNSDRFDGLADIHFHGIPGVDDGSGSMDETAKMIEMAAAQGVKCSANMNIWMR
ncbi:MAG: hypothetical protein MR991_07330 [Clostridiales bacterium]|nr:hypothetical protein [Clostridiales bacterium]MDD7035668.1 hypothetical protein [Bacillota bacterium]MDY2920684.1 CpsB/CapC family capsule biosynthesis tyrosine phosphatase [Lentihominibacter sp.]